MSCLIYDLETMNLSTTCIAKEEMELESSVKGTQLLKKIGAPTTNIDQERI